MLAATATAASLGDSVSSSALLVGVILWAAASWIEAGVSAWSVLLPLSPLASAKSDESVAEGAGRGVTAVAAAAREAVGTALEIEDADGVDEEEEGTGMITTADAAVLELGGRS